jgi:hypothetical protein
MPLYLKVVLPIAGLILGIFSLTIPEGARSQQPTDGHCQVNRSQNELTPTRPMCGASSRLLDARLLLPDPKGFRPGAAIMAGAETVTPWPEVAVDDGVRREEILRLAG